MASARLTLTRTPFQPQLLWRTLMGPDEVWEDDRGSVLPWGHKCRKLVLKSEN